MAHNPSGVIPTDIQDGIKELETHRTIGLTRMESAGTRNERPESDAAAPEHAARYEVVIASMNNGLDGGQGVVEGDVEIVEYLNGEYVSSVRITSSAIVAPDTPLNLIEDRLLNSARETILRLAALSQTDLRSAVDATKEDQDQAYQ
ncbi:MAG: hypothetical protein ACOZAM_04565 [Pseudomonadota bacterium]